MDENVTVVPAGFLDELDRRPPEPNEPTRRAFLRARILIERVDDPDPLF